MGVTNCKTDSGLFEESFLPSREIREEEIRGRDVPYFLGYKLSPFEFPLTLLFDELESEQRREIARWLLQPSYKALIFQNQPERIFYCMYTGDVTEFHNGLKQGYVKLSMRCNSPFSYSHVYETPFYDFSVNTVNGQEIEVYNYGDDLCKPLLYLRKVGVGDVSIVNLADDLSTFKMTNVLDGDMLEIDNEYKKIKTTVSGEYRYDNHNGTYIRLIRGLNKLKVYGNCNLQFKYQLKFYQG